MEFLVNRHPCAVAGVMVVASIIILILGMAAGLWGLLMGDIVFVLALLAGTAGIILRRRERCKIIGYCEKCGQSRALPAARSALALDGGLWVSPYGVLHFPQRQFCWIAGYGMNSSI